jgi:glycosyltransferase involved in cell wall biosynthesis
MRILFISNFYPPHELGGLEQLCRDTVVGLHARGHTCTVLTSQFSRGDKGTPEPHVIRQLHLAADIEHYRPIRFFTQRRLYEQRNLKTVARMVQDFQPEIIFVWGMWNLERSLAAWCEQYAAVPVVYYVADLWPLEPDAHTAYWSLPARHPVARLLHEPLRRRALRVLRQEEKPASLKFERVLCVSDFIRRALLERGNFSGEFTVVHNGIDPQAFTPRDWVDGCHTPFALTFIGALVPHKGLHILIEALSQLQSRQDVPPVNLTIFGGGSAEYEQAMRDKIRAAELEHQVTFKGRVPREKIIKLLSGFDALVLPSVWEDPLPRVPMEAMASKVPVIASLTGGTPELVVSGENSLGFAGGDAQALAEQIAYLVGSPEVAGHLAERGYETVLKKFTLTRMFDEIETCLEGICYAS